MSLESHLLLKTRVFDVVDVTRTVEPGQVLRRQVVRHPGAVAIVPVVDDEHVCLIRNFRLSVDCELFELPAGTREPDEAPEVTAARELTEETGYRAERLRFVTRFYMSPGILDEEMFLYVATGLTAGQRDLQEGEQIENHVVRWSEALEMIADGRIRDAKTIVGLLMYHQYPVSPDGGPAATSQPA